MNPQDSQSELEGLVDRIHNNLTLDEGVAEVEAYVTTRVKEAEKAFGGCKKCYGKGYSTVASGTIGYSDFGGEGFKTPIKTKIKFCECSRGEQLEALTNTTNGKEE